MIAVGPEDAAPGGDAAAEHACEAGLVRAFEFLGKRWNGVILGTLSSGPAGFAELRRGVGSITDSVLSDRLTELADGGLIDRRGQAPAAFEQVERGNKSARRVA